MAFISSVPLTTRPQTQNGSITSRPVRTSRATRVPRMVVVEATNVSDMDKILGAAAESLVVVDYSTSWCGPCKIIAPVFEEMSEKYTDVVFVKVMGDADPDTAELMQREGIRAVPAFHFWKGGSKVKTFTGAKSEEIEKIIEEHK